MKKPTPPSPRWVINLRTLMTARQLNPRSLSLKAGLNATAVRDMLEGRTRFPRYDTVLALAKALGVTASELMGGETKEAANSALNPSFDEDLELLTEIISRLQEVVEDYNHALGPRDFAAMVASLYRRMKLPGKDHPVAGELEPRIVDLLEYESLRRKNKS